MVLLCIASLGAAVLVPSSELLPQVLKVLLAGMLGLGATAWRFRHEGFSGWHVPFWLRAFCALLLSRLLNRTELASADSGGLAWLIEALWLTLGAGSCVAVLGLARPGLLAQGDLQPLLLRQALLYLLPSAIWALVGVSLVQAEAQLVCLATAVAINHMLPLWLRRRFVTARYQTLEDLRVLLLGRQL